MTWQREAPRPCAAASWRPDRPTPAGATRHARGPNDWLTFPDVTYATGHNPSPRPAAARAVVGRRLASWGLALAVVAAVLLTVAVRSGWAVVASFDEALTSFTRGWADPLGWPVDAAHAIGLATAPRWSLLTALVLVLLLFLARYRAAAGLLALSAVLGAALTELAKLAVGRQRPPGAGQFEPDLDMSFPSGHSSAGIYLFLATGVILLQLGRARGSRLLTAAGWVLVVFGPSLGLTRLVLGVHWPSDILAGWAFGCVGLLTGAVLLWWAVDAGWRRPAAAPEPDGCTPSAAGRGGE